MSSVDWQKKSHDAKDLIRKLLERSIIYIFKFFQIFLLNLKDPSKRLTASDALKHVWFKTAVQN